jgi:hypothetical protein
MTDGGKVKVATKKDKRKGNTSPHGLYATPKSAKAKKRKPKLAGGKGRRGSFGKTTGRGGINYGRGGGKGMRTSKSCKS